MGISIEEQREKIRKKKRELSEKYLEERQKNRFYLCDYLTKGIYFLYKNNKIVYIGKSDNNIFRRICDHYEEKSKEFDSFTFKKYDVSNKALLKIESILIKKYSPICNKIYNKYNNKPRILYGRSRN